VRVGLVPARAARANLAPVPAGKKPSLPLFGARRAPAPPPPRIDDARTALGGRAETTALAGSLVRVRSGEASTLGAVVFADEARADVWIGEGRIRRLPLEALTPATDAAHHPLAAVAADARVYAALREGAAVRFLTSAGDAREGTLLEKCRYGGLVRDAEGRVHAVSFRRLLPPARGPLD
jgi:hypothetical protein